MNKKVRVGGVRKKYIYKCKHGRQKSRCKDCGVNGIDGVRCTGRCQHDRRKDRCKECGVNGIDGVRCTGRCQHGRSKYSCKECKSRYLPDPPIPLTPFESS